MHFLAFLLCLIPLALCIIEPRDIDGPTSHEAPTDLPIDWHILSQAAGMAHEPYCLFGDIGDRVGDAEVLWRKGHGVVIQRVKIFHSKSLGVTVSFEGTTASLLSILHDVNAALIDPPKEVAPAYCEGVKLFAGFSNAYMELRDEVYEQIVKFQKQFNDKRVTTTGHSLGAAMSVLAAMDLNKRLDDGIYRSFAFGMPRTGNGAFANDVDKKIGGRFFYIVNGRDWVPRVLPRELGFQHPSGQIWINPPSTTHWKYYPGQENHYGANSEDPILTFDDHHGIYFHTGLGHGPGKCPASVGTA